MRAYILKRYGGPEGSELTDIPDPTPGPRDVLIAVRAAGLNPVDFKFRKGQLHAILRPKRPFVLGNEVKKFGAGDRVFARVAKDRGGAFAERACVDESLVAKIPKNLDFTTAAVV